MKHNEHCNSWPNYHPYDCPECKIWDVMVEVAEDNLYEQIEEARNEGYEEAQDEYYWERNRIADSAFQEGIEEVVDNPNKYGLVKANV
jgi:hypothetical protein